MKTSPWGESAERTLSVLAIAVMTLTGASDGETAAGHSPDSKAGATSQSQPQKSDSNADDDDAAGVQKTPDPEPLSYSERVVVTATRTEQRLMDASAAVTVLTEQDIENSAADNFADLFRGIPGVNVIQTTARAVHLRARGATSLDVDSMRIMIDGRAINEGAVSWDYLPINFDDIESIEVVRGPSSIVWGPNSQSGVVNIRTKSPKDVRGGFASVIVGGVGTKGITGRWADSREKLGYKVSFNHFEQDPWERSQTLANGTPLPPSFQFENDGTSQQKLDLRVDYEADSGSLWSFRSGIASSSGINHTVAGPISIDDGDHIGYAEVDLRANDLQVKAFWNWGRGSFTDLFSSVSQVLNRDVLYVEASKRRLLLGRHALVYGGNLRLLHSRGDIFPGENARYDGAGFAQGLFQLTDELFVDTGVRVDYFEKVGTIPSPRVSVRYKPHPDHAVRFTYSRAYRAPSMIENFIVSQSAIQLELIPGQPPFVSPLQIVGNLDAQEISTNGFELAYTTNLHKRATATVTAYHNTVNGSIATLPNAFYGPENPPPGWPLPAAFVPMNRLPSTLTFLNQDGEVVNKGLELSLNATGPHGLGVASSYTFQAEPDIKGGAQQINLPAKNQASASVSVTQPQWRSAVSINYTDEAFWADIFDANFWSYTGDYTLLNATFSFTPSASFGEVIIKGTNLLDETVQQHIFGDIIGRKITLEYKRTF